MPRPGSLSVPRTIPITTTASSSFPVAAPSSDMAQSPAPQHLGTFIGACQGEYGHSCVHDIPGGWALLTAGGGAPIPGVLTAPKVRRNILVKHHEVTQAEWERLMQTQPSFFGACEDCPVERVSWWDALIYLNRLSEVDGFERCYELQGCQTAEVDGCPSDRPWCEGQNRCTSARFIGPHCDGYRLPTEQEWTWLAQASAAKEAETAWCANRSGGRTRPVAGGVESTDVDGVRGNVWEWVWGSSESASRQLHRGGSFRTAPSACQANAQSVSSGSWRSYFIGFRPVRTLPLASRPVATISPRFSAVVR